MRFNPPFRWVFGLAALCVWAAPLTITAAGYREVELNVPKEGRTGFTLMDSLRAGIAFTNYISQERHLTNQILLNGSGVALGDVDGDGWCDLYFCALDRPNALFKNLGQWRFKDITTEAGVACAGQDSTGALLEDLDGDGDLDLVVNSIGWGTRLFFNDGGGRFAPLAGQELLNPGRCGMSAAAADMDGDGDLDLYLTNYRTVTLMDQPNTKFAFKIVNGQAVVHTINGRPLTDPDLTNRFNFNITLTETGGKFSHDENGEADLLLRNDGQGVFTPVSFTEGDFLDEDGLPLANPPFDWGLSVMFRDLNGDGAPDLYVCNDFKTPDRIWLNNGRGQFRAAPSLAIRHTSLSSMGVDVADVDRDGHDDIFVLDMLSRDHRRRFSQRMAIRPEILPPGLGEHRPQYPHNTLHWNRGDGTYAEVAPYSGVEASDWSWTPVFLDVDLDGYEDLLISNGFERDGMNVDVLMQLEALKKERPLSSEEQLRLRSIFPRLDTRNVAFRNRGDLHFEEVGASWGFNAAEVSYGIALADLDNDGDLDAVVSQMNTPPGLYRNETSAPRVAVRLKGRSSNTRGVGASVKLTAGGRVQSQVLVGGGRYLCGDDAMRVFAAMDAPRGLEIRWPSGKVSRVEAVQSNRLYEVDEAGAESSRGEAKPGTGSSAVAAEREPLFEDVSDRLRHEHVERAFDDFARQPLLSHRLSQPGPGVAWFDYDDDGDEDLFIGSGAGGQLAAYRNDGRGGFERLTGPPYATPVTRDQTGLVAWKRAGNEGKLLVGSSNYEDGLAQGSVVREYGLNGRPVTDTLPGQVSSTGPLALGDVDGDGDLDLFVGGRVVPGRFPEAASSLIFRNTDDRFELDVENQAALKEVGLVNGAVLSDLDGDGDPDLVLACQWGAVRVLMNERGRFQDETKSQGLDRYLGWWNGVATGDFDGDGRLDIVASNWGSNSHLEAFRRNPLRLYYGDFDGNTSVETVEAYVDAKDRNVWPAQPFHVVGEAMPLLRLSMPKFDDYARATLPEIYGEPLKSAAVLEANWLETTLFLNRGGVFEARILPKEAQVTPAFAVCVADFDGDGREDLFLSQNFFAVHPEISRQDAGRGLLLGGDGRGGFKAWSAQDSGLRIYGEQRGAAAADYDRDGRVDLVVSQNAAGTKLYRNVRAMSGLRIRLLGREGNPSAVGASLRWVWDDKKGPIREVQAGSGYLSQDSAVQVMAWPTAAASLWVRWPGGRETQLPVPLGAKEVWVQWDGKLRVP